MNLLETTRVIIKSLLVSSPEPLTIDQLNRDYEKQEGSRIPFAKLGYANLKEFLLSMPETLTYDPAKRSLTVRTNNGGNSEHIQKLVSNQKTGKKKSNNSRPFNHSNNNGQNRDYPTNKIWDYHPMNSNQLNYNVNYSQPNYNSSPGNLLARPGHLGVSILGVPTMPPTRPMPPPRPMLPLMSINLPTYHVTNQTPTTRYDSNGRTKNVNKYNNDAVKKNSESNCNSSTNVESKSNRKLNGDADALDETVDSNSKEIGALPPMDDDDPINLIGSKMMSSKYGRSIPSATVPKNVQSGHIQQIYVTEVTKFPYFYFQFAGTDDTMRGLQDELDSIYDDDTHAERIRRSEIRTGNVCAAYYANKWSRAQILSLDDIDRVKVLFVDYGTIDYVSIKETRYLHSAISEIPRLCHRAALAFVKPLRTDQHEMEKKMVQKFCDMVANRALMAVFSNVDECDDISITLVDTSDKKVDLIVNQILMEKLNGIESYKSDCKS